MSCQNKNKPSGQKKVEYQLFTSDRNALHYPERL